MKKNNFQRIMRVIYLIAAVLSFITVVNFSFYLTDRSLSVCTLSKTNVTAVKIKKSDKHQGDENALAHIKLINKNLQIEENKKAWGILLANHPFNNRPSRSMVELKKIPKKDRPDLAMEQNFLMTMDPETGEIPYERMIRANRQVDILLGRRTAISGVSWEERGPDNVGGRTRALMFDPNDVTNKKVWAGGVGGGLWFTDDITATNPVWNHVNGFWDNITISCIAYNPNNTQEIYVGTGEGWYNSDAQRGGGIWKTTNGGTTWWQLANTDPGSYNSSSHFHYVNKIVIKNDGTIFAATRGYYTNYGGIMRSTDTGSTWTRVLNVYTVSTTLYDRAADIEIAANGDLYASFGIFSDGKVFKSTNANNGAISTWTDLSSNVGISSAQRIELACAPSDEDIIYAVGQGGSGNNDIEWFKKSTDGGTNWSSITIPKLVDDGTTHFTRAQAWYDLILMVHPTNASLVIAGGIDLHRTTDGGSNWTGISHWYGGFSKPEVHADQHAMQFRPGSSNEVIFGSDGGVHYSTNAGNSSATPTFSNKNTSYNITQFYACATKNEVNSHYFLSGSQDNGSQQFKNPRNGVTTEVTGGDGAYCHIDQLNSDIQTTSYVYNKIYRSLDGGANFSVLINESSGHFINPSEYDNTNKILYAAAGNNQLKRLSGMDATITNSTKSISVGTAQVSALKISPTNDVLFLGIENGRVYKYADASTASPTLTRIDNGTTPISTAAWVSSIDVGSSDNHLIVTYSNYGVTSIWETTDGGTNWYSKEGNLPDMPVRWALFNPDDRDEVLLATEVGVWSTDDFGTGTTSSPDWDPSNTDLAHTRCDMLKYRSADKMVVVATHGRGLFTTDIFATSAVADFDYDQNTSCTGSVSVSFYDGSIKPNNSWAWDIDNDGITDYTTENPTHTYSSSGIYSVSLTVDNGSSAVTKENIITVMSSEPTTSSGCTLSSNSNNGNIYGIGISRFALGNIDHSTPENDGYYNNYACSQSTELELATLYTITIKTGTSNNEGAKVYIDYDDNGTFANSEAVASFAANKEGARSDTFTTPYSGITLDKGYRLRVLSEFSSIPSNACDIGTYGQAEDYTVYFVSDASWNGSVSTDWNNATNWTPKGVPATGADISIPNMSNDPILDQNRTIYALTIASGGVLTIPAGKTLTVNGNLLNNAGNSGLIINSTASGTGNIIHQVPSVSGTVERYITGNSSNEPYHFISSPIKNLAFSSIWTSGDYNVYWYDESNTSGIDQGWTRILSGNLSNGRGYSIVSNYSNRTLSMAGSLMVPSDISSQAAVTYTSSATSDNDGWNLIGNPYPCALNTTEFLSDNSSLLETGYAAVYFYDNPDGDRLRGDYATRNSSGGTQGGSATTPDATIALGQAFFVKVKSSTSNISFASDQRTANSGTQFFTPEMNDKQHSWLSVNGPDSSYNETLISFLPDANSHFDPGYDAIKLRGNPYIALYTFIEGIDHQYVIQALPSADLESEIPVKVPIGLFAGKSGLYSFSIARTENLNSNIYMEDLERAVVKKIDSLSHYEVELTKGEYNDRFVLHYNYSANSVESRLHSGLDFTIYTSDNKLVIKSLTKLSEAKVKIFTLKGKEVKSIDIPANETIVTDLNELSKALYMYTLLSDNQYFSGKIIIK